MSDDDSTGNDQSTSSRAAEADEIISSLREKKREFDIHVRTSLEHIKKETLRVKEAVDIVQSSTTELTELENSIRTAHSAINNTLSLANTELSQVREILTEAATTKGTLDALQGTASDDVGIITQSKANVEALVSGIKERQEALKNEHESVSVQISDLEEDKASLTSVLEKLKKIEKSAEESAEKVEEHFSEVKNIRDEFVNTAEDTQKKHDELISTQANLQTIIDHINEANNKISELYAALFESTEETKSTEFEIATLQEKIKEALSEINKDRESSANALTKITSNIETESKLKSTEIERRFHNLYQLLEQKILSLLPSAGAAGLASTYFDAKSRYSPTAYTGNLSSGHNNTIAAFFQPLRRIFGNNPTSVVSTIFFYFMFIAPLVALTYGTYELVEQLEEHPETAFDYRVLLLRFLIAVPLATISAFGFTSLRLYRKLYEEYNHKQRVMELYRSFRNEIDENGDADQTKELLKIMLESVATKAWNSSDQKKELSQNTKFDTDENLIGHLDSAIERFQKLKSLASD